MASRKKAPPPAQPSLFAFPTLTASPVAAPEIRVEVTELPKPESGHGAADEFGGEDFPSDTPVVEERKLRLVPPPDRGPEEDVIVEPQPSGLFAVSLVRHYGSTVATVLYSRKQLEMLLARIPAALEVG